ncbi:MAG TPA: exodeoxyribonuclease VII large subunit [Aequorivita sp.]|nr:exodeoxyribonuclease VII large subunit [Aequorivita sp.]
MSESKENIKIFTLLEVTKSIERTLANRYKSSYWIKAEMNKLNYYPHSGHCYPSLVEKRDGKVIAEIRGVLWKTDYLRINKRFQEILKEPLKDGIKILFLARISYNPTHGLSLIISDIDPSFTLGDLEKEKQETIKRLHKEGVFHKNQQLNFPLLPQRIAIISVETSKGYADFLKIIQNNSWNYKFFLHLFPALLQGDKAAERISHQLERIKKVKHHFDVVAIIRGGGGEVGLSCYNNYELATQIADFPIPVVTGIGHATNETVSEMVAFSNAITPSKLAQFLLQKFHDFSVPVQEAERKLKDKSQRILKDEKTRFHSEIKLFRSLTENVLNTNRSKIANTAASLVQQVRFRFKNEDGVLRDYVFNIGRNSNFSIDQSKLNIIQIKDKLFSKTENQLQQSELILDNIEKNIHNMDPKNVLKRGYSITRFNGKAIKEISEIKPGDLLQTIIFDGVVESTVTKTK